LFDFGKLLASNSGLVYFWAETASRVILGRNSVKKYRLSEKYLLEIIPFAFIGVSGKGGFISCFLLRL